MGGILRRRSGTLSNILLILFLASVAASSCSKILYLEVNGGFICRLSERDEIFYLCIFSLTHLGIYLLLFIVILIHFKNILSTKLNIINNSSFSIFFELLWNLFKFVWEHWLMSLILHAELSYPARHTPKLCCKTEHLGKRNISLQDKNIRSSFSTRDETASFANWSHYFLLIFII